MDNILLNNSIVNNPMFNIILCVYLAINIIVILNATKFILKKESKLQILSLMITLFLVGLPVHILGKLLYTLYIKNNKDEEDKEIE